MQYRRKLWKGAKETQAGWWDTKEFYAFSRHLKIALELKPMLLSWPCYVAASGNVGDAEDDFPYENML